MKTKNGAVLLAVLILSPGMTMFSWAAEEKEAALDAQVLAEYKKIPKDAPGLTKRLADLHGESFKRVRKAERQEAEAKMKGDREEKMKREAEAKKSAGGAPANEDPEHKLIRELFQAKDWDRLIVVAKEKVEKGDKDGKHLLAAAYEHAGRTDEALKVLEDAKKAEPENQSSYEAQAADVCRLNRRSEEAVKHYEAAAATEKIEGRRSYYKKQVEDIRAKR